MARVLVPTTNPGGSVPRFFLLRHVQQQRQGRIR